MTFAKFNGGFSRARRHVPMPKPLLLVLVLISMSRLVTAEICYICGGRDMSVAVANVLTKITIDGTETSCQFAALDGVFEDIVDCSAAQATAAEFCGCEPEPEEFAECIVCQEPNTLTLQNSNREVVYQGEARTCFTLSLEGDFGHLSDCAAARLAAFESCNCGRRPAPTTPPSPPSTAAPTITRAPTVSPTTEAPSTPFPTPAQILPSLQIPCTNSDNGTTIPALYSFDYFLRGTEVTAMQISVSASYVLGAGAPALAMEPEVPDVALTFYRESGICRFEALPTVSSAGEDSFRNITSLQTARLQCPRRLNASNKICQTAIAQVNPNELEGVSFSVQFKGDCASPSVLLEAAVTGPEVQYIGGIVRAAVGCDEADLETLLPPVSPDTTSLPSDISAIITPTIYKNDTNTPWMNATNETGASNVTSTDVTEEPKDTGDNGELFGGLFGGDDDTVECFDAFFNFAGCIAKECPDVDCGKKNAHAFVPLSLYHCLFGCICFSERSRLTKSYSRLSY